MHCALTALSYENVLRKLFDDGGGPSTRAMQTARYELKTEHRMLGWPHFTLDDNHNLSERENASVVCWCGSQHPGTRNDANQRIEIFSDEFVGGIMRRIFLFQTIP